jgi:hypothetical protein
MNERSCNPAAHVIAAAKSSLSSMATAGCGAGTHGDALVPRHVGMSRMSRTLSWTRRPGQQRCVVPGELTGAADGRLGAWNGWE